jgi:hypothetical protein
VEDTEIEEVELEVPGETQEVVEETQESVVEESTPEPGEVKYTKNVEKRIGKITREKYELAQQLEKVRLENEKLKGTSTRPPRPNIQSFTDEYGNLDSDRDNESIAAYEDNLYTWRENQRSAENMKITAQANQEARMEDFHERAEAVRAKHDDFDEAISKPIFTDHVINELFETDPEVVYYLATNEKEAIKFNNMPPSKVGRELGKLEEKINSLSKKTSSAPEPITPVGGTGVLPDSNNLSDDEWFKTEEQRRLNDLKKKVG